MIYVVILCGGFGTRFQKVSTETPKILANLKSGLTMLDWLIDYYLPQDLKIILATGHLHQSIEQYVSNKEYNNRVEFSFEDKPLGTAGAIVKASRKVSNLSFIVINGDTIQEIDFNKFYQKSTLKENSIINIGCTKYNFNDSGTLLLDDNSYVSQFLEKQDLNAFGGNHVKYTNLGIYCCQTQFFRDINIQRLSLEEELLPKLVKKKLVQASIFDVDFHDFGTLERYNDVSNYISKKYNI